MQNLRLPACLHHHQHSPNCQPYICQIEDEFGEWLFAELQEVGHAAFH